MCVYVVQCSVNMPVVVARYNSMRAFLVYTTHNVYPVARHPTQLCFLSLYLATLGNRNCQVLRKYIDPVANRMASNTFHYLLSKAHSYFIYRNRGECKLFMLSRDISLLTHHYTSNTNCIMEKWLLVDVKIRGSEGRRVRCDEPTSSDMATDSRSHTQMCVVCPDIIMSLTPFLCNSFLTGSSFDNTIFILSRNIFR